MKIQIRTLTPLWTGGVETSRMDRIHEIGIIGGLRWWYEAIVRGLGGQACDPSKHECPDRDDNYCAVCQIFGATGWKRRFQLVVMQDETKRAWEAPDQMLNVRPRGRQRGRYLPPGRVGYFTLQITGQRQTLKLLAALFLFLERYGTIGAKPQLGYGVFKIENQEEIKNLAQDWKWQVMNSLSANNQYPDLRHFGFFRYRFNPDSPNWWTRISGIERIASKVKPVVSAHKSVPLTPALKNEWRFHRWKGSREDERLIFGSLRPDRTRSKVAVSWAYAGDDGWEMRGWVWLQKADIAANVWHLLQDNDAWQKVIGIGGKLESYPGGAWRKWNSQAVASLLEATT